MQKKIWFSTDFQLRSKASLKSATSAALKLSSEDMEVTSARGCQAQALRPTQPTSCGCWRSTRRNACLAASSKWHSKLSHLTWSLLPFPPRLLEAEAISHLQQKRSGSCNPLAPSPFLSACLWRASLWVTPVTRWIQCFSRLHLFDKKCSPKRCRLFSSIVLPTCVKFSESVTHIGKYALKAAPCCTFLVGITLSKSVTLRSFCRVDDSSSSTWIHGKFWEIKPCKSMVNLMDFPSRVLFGYTCSTFAHGVFEPASNVKLFKVPGLPGLKVLLFAELSLWDRWRVPWSGTYHKFVAKPDCFDGSKCRQKSHGVFTELETCKVKLLHHAGCDSQMSRNACYLQYVGDDTIQLYRDPHNPNESW